MQLKSLTDLAEFLDMLLTRAAIELTGASGTWYVSIHPDTELQRVQLVYRSYNLQVHDYWWLMKDANATVPIEVKEANIDRGIQALKIAARIDQ